MITAFSISQCRREKINTTPFDLTFNDDTLLFDTVFTNLSPSTNPPSIYEVLKVKNTSKLKVKTNISLAGGVSSPFRINVDGQSGTDFTNYEIAAGDSLYIFVEAYLKQNNINNPLVITDSIIFENNGKLQNVKLVAWGQDAHYLAESIITQNTTWKNDGKPYVLYNFVAVDYKTKLTIEKGVHIYSHNNVRLYIGGTLDVQGDTNDKVIFEADRLQWEYKEVPNQWVGIRFLPESINNKIKNCIIKNAIVGIEVDSVPVSGTYNLTLDQVEIKNMGQVGIVGYSAAIKAINCLIYNCGKYTFAGVYGGKYDIYNSTFAVYNNTYINRKTAHFGFNNEVFKDANGIPLLMVALDYHLENNIIYGDQEEEIEIGLDPNNSTTTGEFFQKNIFKTKKLESKFLTQTNLVNEDPKFSKTDAMNYELNSDSKAISFGNIIGVNIDIRGKSRSGNPDIGCYEIK